MNCNYVFDDNGKPVVRTTYETIDLKSVTRDKIVWIDFKSDDRGEAVNFLNQFSFGDEINEAIMNPGDSIRLRLFKNTAIVDLDVCNYTNELQTGIVTLILLEKITICISNENFDYLESVLKEWNSMPNGDGMDPKVMAYGFFNYIMEINTHVAAYFNSKVAEYSRRIMGKPFHDNISEIEVLKRDVTSTLEVLEDQYTSFGLMPIHFTHVKEERQEMLKRIVMGIEHLQRVLERADDKLDTIYHKYQYDLQVINNNRINILTIIQSIFVPITFISGLYGMNFIDMPELNWASGYYYALGLMAFVTAVEVYIIRKSGWFR